MLCHSKHLVFYSKESCFLNRDFVLCWLAADYTLMYLGRFYVNTSSHISWIQRIETCISRGAAEWNTRFQWVEWRKYDYISWVDQVNNFWTPQASNCPLFSLKNWIKVTPQMKRLVNMNLVFITYTNIFEKLVNIIPIFHTLSCIYHLVIKNI